MTDQDVYRKTIDWLRSHGHDAVTASDIGMARSTLCDIPTRGFLNALCLIEPPGRVTFNLRDLFLSEQNTTGYDELIKQLLNSGELRIHTTSRFQHRRALTGDPIHYVCVVGQKSESSQ